MKKEQRYSEDSLLQLTCQSLRDGLRPAGGGSRLVPQT